MTDAGEPKIILEFGNEVWAPPVAPWTETVEIDGKSYGPGLAALAASFFSVYDAYSQFVDEILRSVPPMRVHRKMFASLEYDETSGQLMPEFTPISYSPEDLRGKEIEERPPKPETWRDRPAML